jgi:hypothetical protein
MEKGCEISYNRNQCRSSSLTVAAREVIKHKFHLVGVQQVRWDKGGAKRAGDCIFSYGTRSGFFVHHRIVTTVRSVQFFSDRMSYIVLRGRWCNIILFNAHETTVE